MSLVLAALRVYMIVIVVRAIFSWLPPHHRQSEIYAFLHAITEPVLAPVRKVLPTAGGIDFSPLVVILLLSLLMRVLGGV